MKGTTVVEFYWTEEDGYVAKIKQWPHDLPFSDDADEMLLSIMTDAAMQLDGLTHEAIRVALNS